MLKTADRHRARLLLWGSVIVLTMGAIFFFSSQPAGDSSSLSDFLLNTPFGQLLMRLLPALSDQGASHDIRKYAHMTEFFCLGVSVCIFTRELFSVRPVSIVRPICVSWLFCLFYACTDEFHQLFVEGRSCQLSDVGVDCAGFTLGIILSLAAARLLPHIKNDIHLRGRRNVHNGRNN